MKSDEQIRKESAGWTKLILGAITAVAGALISFVAYNKIYVFVNRFVGRDVIEIE